MYKNWCRKTKYDTNNNNNSNSNSNLIYKAPVCRGTPVGVKTWWPFLHIFRGHDPLSTPPMIYPLHLHTTTVPYTKLFYCWSQDQLVAGAYKVIWCFELHVLRVWFVSHSHTWLVIAVRDTRHWELNHDKYVDCSSLICVTSDIVRWSRWIPQQKCDSATLIICIVNNNNNNN